MPVGQEQLERDGLATTAVIEREVSGDDVAGSTAAGVAALRLAVSPSKQAEEPAVRTESTEVLSGVLAAATGGATARGVVRRLDDGLRRVAVL